MCVKLLLRDLNPNPYPLHPTSTYTCGVTIAPRMSNSNTSLFLKKLKVRLFEKKKKKT